MDKDKWIFYTDLFGRQRWERISRSGATVAESDGSFRCLAAAMADASLAGYVAGDDCVACAFEWTVSRSVCPEDDEERSCIAPPT